MAMGTTFAIRNSLSLSRVKRHDSQGGKCKDLSVFSRPLTLCRRPPCIVDFFLPAGIADQIDTAQGDSPYMFGQSFTKPVYRNTGQECRPTRNLTLRADTFNILGWFNETQNKRAHYFRGSDYSVEAAAVTFPARSKF